MDHQRALLLGCVERHFSFFDEVDSSELIAWFLHIVVCLEDTTKHVDDELILEADFVVVEEQVELFSKVAKDRLNNLSLHFGSDLLVK